MITAPAAVAAGRWFWWLAPAFIRITLLLATWHLPRECYNRDGQPKIKHKSRKEAIQHKHSLQRDTGQPGWSLKVYLCKRCGFWHVGHTGTRRRRGGRP
jgi:hypothetical protein